MPRYKLDSGIWFTKTQEFKNDEAAWETLRKLLPGKWASLYKEISIGKILNYKKNKKKYESKYELQKIDDRRNQYVLILFGTTSDPYENNISGE